MMALKEIYMRDYRIAVTNKKKSFYYCHVITCYRTLIDTYVYVATNVGDTN